MPAGVLTAEIMRSSQPGSAGWCPPLPDDAVGLSGTAAATGPVARGGFASSSSCSAYTFDCFASSPGVTARQLPLWIPNL